jgi:hypothetical protein
MDGAPRPEDDGLLASIGRQGAAPVLTGLATPTDEPNSITDLFRYLYGASATPAGAAAASAKANASVAPWGGAPPAAQQQTALDQQQRASQAMMAAGLQQQQQQQQLYMQQQQQQQQQQPVPQFSTAGGQQYGSQGLPASLPPASLAAMSKLTQAGGGSLVSSPMLSSANSMQPSLPEGMLLRQQGPAPHAQTRFVPQQPQGSAGGAGGGTPTVTAPGAAPLLPCSSSGSSMTSAPSAQQQYEAMLMQQHMMAMMLPQGSGAPHAQAQATDAGMQAAAAAGFAAACQQAAQGTYGAALSMMMQQQGQAMAGGATSAQQQQQQQQQQQWGPEELRQLLDILGEAANGDGGAGAMYGCGAYYSQAPPQQQPALPAMMGQAPQQPMGPLQRQLCDLGDQVRSCDSEEVERTNNVTGRVVTGTA